MKVTVDADGIRIDDARVAARSDIAARAPIRIEPLFDRLKAHREEWKTANPDRVFPDAADLVLPADATCIEVENLLRTIAYAAYSHIVIDPGSANALNVDYGVPLPPAEGEPDADPPLPMQVRFRTDGKVRLSRTCTGTPQIVDPPDVPRMVSTVASNVVRFGCDDGVRFSAVRPTLAALRAARATKLDSDECASTLDGGVPAHVLAGNLGLAGIGERPPLVHRPGTLGPTIVTTQGIDATAANAALGPRLPAIAACFEDQRSAPSPFIGLGNFDGDHTTIDLVIAGDGGVALVQNGGASSELDLCIGRLLASLEFAPFDAATAKVSYEFVFKDAKK